jgi:hypothetical protein
LTIEFNIAPGGPQTIRPLAPLPFLNGPRVNIDATTQPGFNGTPIIEIDGSCANGGCTVDPSDDSVAPVHGISGAQFAGLIRGFVINNFSGSGIWGSATQLFIEGNYIGTDLSGTIARPNFQGISLGHSSHMTIGGSSLRQRNVISGNTYDGIGFSAGDNIVVEGNYVGIDASGLAPLPNGSSGIFVSGWNCRVGGLTEGARNVIAGHHAFQVWLHSGGNHSVVGNYIGTDATGQSWINGGRAQVYSDDSHHNVIGGDIPAARNIIAGVIGVTVRGSSHNHFEGNYFGVGADGTSSLPLNVAVLLNDAAHDNVIGGSTEGSGNLIQDEWLPGSENHAAIVLHVNAGAGNAILGNSFISPNGMGIDIDTGTTDPSVIDPDPNPTPNDHLDLDSGPNNAQNSPEISAVSISGSSAVFSGLLDSTPNTQFRIEFYSNPTSTVPTAYRGHTFLDFIEVTTDSDGIAPIATIDATLNLVDPSHRVFVATATRLAADGSPLETSEFSAPIGIAPRTVSVNIQPESINVDSNGTLTVLVYGAADFDASQIDVSTVDFAGAAAWQWNFGDHNHDGFVDLQLKFRRQDTDLEALYAELLVDDHDADGVLDSTQQLAEVAVTGQTLDDQLFSGSDDLTLFLSGQSLRNLLDDLFG